MNTEDEVLSATRAIIERVVGPGRTPADVGPHTPLGDGFWLDSVELLEVIVACEREFGIAFDDADELERGGLETVGSLAALIRARQAGRQRRP